MADKIQIEIVTPEAMVVSDEVDEITVTGTEGEFGVLPGHCHMLSSLKVGAVNYKKDNTVKYLALGGGYAQVGPDKVTILAETAERAEEIDAERARKAVSSSEEALNNFSSDDKKYKEVQHSLEKAMLRVEVANK